MFASLGSPFISARNVVPIQVVWSSTSDERRITTGRHKTRLFHVHFLTIFLYLSPTNTNTLAPSHAQYYGK